MYTIHLTPGQTKVIDRAVRKLEAETGKRFSRAAAVEYLCDYILANKEEVKRELAAKKQPR